MKTMSKKLASIVLALCLCFSLVGTALAAEIQTYSSSTDTTFSITVTGAANGETYTAYKIFDVTYSNADSEGNVSYAYTIDSSSAWYSTVAAATNVFTLNLESGSTTKYIVTVNDGVSEDAVIAVFTNADIDLSEVDADATAQASGGQAVLDVTSSGAGYYYVTTSLGSLVIIDTTNPTQTIEEKNGIPTITKGVYKDDTLGKEDEESNGNKVTYELDVEHITGAVNLVIHDSQPTELYEDWNNFHLTSVYLIDGETRIELFENENYTINLTGAVADNDVNCSDPTFNNEHACTFEIDFTGYDFSNVSDSAYIDVIYDATLNTEGDAYQGDQDEIDNWAVVTFGQSSSSTPVEAEVYSFGFEVFKYTGSNEALEGVEFELKNSDEEEADSAWFYKETVDEKIIYLFEGWEEPDGEGYTQTLVTGSDGMIYIEGLDIGTYYLDETKALDGYNPLTGPVTVTIEAEYDEATDTMTHTVTYTYDGETSTGTVNIENSTGTILPGTGGMGTTIFYIIGGVLVAGAVVVLITRRRMSSNEG